jgi:hypothetical protein
MLLTTRLKSLAAAAALEYERQAMNLVGIKLNLAYLYNLERTQFLHGKSNTLLVLRLNMPKKSAT